MRIDSIRFGKRTKHTLRRNRFDKHNIKDGLIYMKNDKPLSLNKHKRWLIQDGDHEIKVIKQKKENEQTTYNNKGSFKVPMHISQSTKKHNPTFNIKTDNDQIDHIEIPFSKYDYPIHNELHTHYNTKCPTCFGFERGSHIWQLRGLGTKSKKKGKGLRKFNKHIEF